MAADVPERPTDLYFVGPATATVFDGAPFEARDVADRRVSYRELLDAGVAPDVADRLRREYSLVWSYVWRVGGEDLPRRAAAISSLGPEERAWIAESRSADEPREPSDRDLWEERRRYLEGRSSGAPEEEPGEETDESPKGDTTVTTDESEEEVCPRCDGTLETFELGDSETVRCLACGYVGVAPR